MIRHEPPKVLKTLASQPPTFQQQQQNSCWSDTREFDPTKTKCEGVCGLACRSCASVFTSIIVIAIVCRLFGVSIQHQYLSLSLSSSLSTFLGPFCAELFFVSISNTPAVKTAFLGGVKTHPQGPNCANFRHTYITVPRSCDHTPAR